MDISYSTLWPVHGILMSVSFLLMLAGVISSRFKGKKWRLKVHKKLGISGSILGVIALAIAIFMISISHGIHLSVPHSIIGFITVILIIANPLIALIMTKGKKINKKILRKYHKLIGFSLLLLMAATITGGLVQVGLIYLP